MAFKTICNKIMKRKVGVSGEIIFNGTSWIKPKDSEYLTKNQKQEERTSLIETLDENIKYKDIIIIEG